MRQITILRETWPLRGVFRIARGGNTEIDVVVVEMPAMLLAIGYHYADFSEVTDEDVQAVLAKGKR